MPHKQLCYELNEHRALTTFALAMYIMLAPRMQLHQCVRLLKKKKHTTSFWIAAALPKLNVLNAHT